MYKVAILFFLLAGNCLAQSAYLSKAINKANSADPDIRVNGMVMLAREDSPQARRQLISLLRRENTLSDKAIAEFGGTAPAYGEGYGDYVGFLAEVVMKISENPEYADGLDALVMSGPEADTQAGRWLAMRGSQVANSVGKLAASPLEHQRYIAMQLSGLILQYETAGKIALKKSDRAAYLGVIHGGLTDRQAYNRQTANELEQQLKRTVPF